METPSRCPSNLGPRETRKRLVFGLAAFAVGGVALAALLLAGYDRWWRLALLLPFWFGCLGVAQARTKT